MITSIGDAFAGVTPAFEHLHLVCFTVFGPYVAGAPMVVPGDSQSKSIGLQSEIRCTPLTNEELVCDGIGQMLTKHLFGVSTTHLQLSSPFITTPRNLMICRRNSGSLPTWMLQFWAMEGEHLSLPLSLGTSHPFLSSLLTTRRNLSRQDFWTNSSHEGFLCYGKCFHSFFCVNMFTLVVSITSYHVFAFLGNLWLIVVIPLMLYKERSFASSL